MIARSLALVGCLFLALVLVGTPPAGAHDDEGQMTVTTAEQVDPSRVVLEVGIVYTNDGHPAETATVTATLTGPDGQVVGPVDLARHDGTSLYRAEIDVPVPGSWTAAVTSTEPAATAEATLEVAETTTTAGPDATTAPDGPPATVDGEGDDGGRLSGPADVASADDGDGGSDNGAAILAAAIVGVLVIAAIAGWVLYRRRASTQGGDVHP